MWKMNAIHGCLRLDESMRFMASSPLPSIYADDVAIVEARELRAGQRAQLHTRATDMQKVSHKSLPLT
jgi:hypothetical protein